MEQFEGFHARPWGEFMFDYKKISKLIGLLALALLFCSLAYPQRQTQGSAAQSAGTETPARAPLHSPDIISDNLDKAAASASQILEVVNKEPGLMVHLNPLLPPNPEPTGQSLKE